MTATTRVIVTALVAVLAGTVSPSSGADVFSACSKNTTNKVRGSSIVTNATAVCRPTETLRTWNEQGPAGPSGSPGPSGPPGPSDAFSTFGEADTPIPSGGHFLTLASLSLDAGNYVVIGKASLSNFNPITTAFAYCAVIRGAGFPGLNDQSLATINGIGTTALSAVLAVNLPTPNVVRFQCTNNIAPGHDGEVEATMITLVAIRVGTLTPQGSPSGAFLSND